MADRAYTAAQIRAGFAEWERRLAADPAAFLTPGEADALEADERAGRSTAAIVAYMDEAEPEVGFGSAAIVPPFSNGWDA